MGPEIRHGLTAYKHSFCRCDICRVANRNACRQASLERRRRLAEDPSIAPHGVRSTYVNWGCRCEPCSTAHKKACRDYYWNKVKKAGA